MLYRGLDFHRSFPYITTMNENGEVIVHKRLPSNAEIVEFLRRFVPEVPANSGARMCHFCGPRTLCCIQAPRRLLRYVGRGSERAFSS